MTQERKPHRSEAYQYKILEVLFSSEHLDSFTVESNKCLLKEKEVSELQALNDELQTLLIGILKASMTPRQIEILEMWAQGLTQMEIAKKLEVNQSSITKSLHGNLDYTSATALKTGKTQRYGGVHKKSLKIVKTSDALKPLCLKIYRHELTEYFRLFAYQTIKNVFKNETEFEIWLGVHPPPVNDLLSQQSIKICGEYLEGMSLKSLSVKYKIPYKKVKAIVKGCP